MKYRVNNPLSSQENRAMYTLSLTEEERQTLMNVLECTISEIHSEIVHCETLNYKDMLKLRKQLLVNLLEELKQSVPSSN